MEIKNKGNKSGLPKKRTVIPGMAPEGTIPGLVPKGTIPDMVPKGQDPPDMGNESDIPTNAPLERSNKDPEVRRRDVAADKKFRRII